MRRRRDVSGDLVPVPDDLPRRQLFHEPIRVADLRLLDVEPCGDGRARVRFQVTVRDAAGARCPDLAVEARIHGPERTGQGMVNTEQFGQAWFEMVGPPGRYECEVLDVAAGAIELVREEPDVVARAAVDV